MISIPVNFQNKKKELDNAIFNQYNVIIFVILVYSSKLAHSIDKIVDNNLHFDYLKFYEKCKRHLTLFWNKKYADRSGLPRWILYGQFYQAIFLSCL